MGWPAIPGAADTCQAKGIPLQKLLDGAEAKNTVAPEVAATAKALVRSTVINRLRGNSRGRTDRPPRNGRDCRSGTPDHGLRRPVADRRRWSLRGTYRKLLTLKCTEMSVPPCA